MDRIQLKPAKAFVLLVITYIGFLGSITWKCVSTAHLHHWYACLFAFHVLALYALVKVGTYRLDFYEDRIVKSLAHKKTTIAYKDIKYLVVREQGFNAYRVMKSAHMRHPERFKKYQIYDVTIASENQKIHFRTKWFDSLQEAKNAMELLNTLNVPRKKGRESLLEIQLQLLKVLGWILLFGCLSMAGTFFL